MAHRLSRGNRRGFSLLELIVVIAIILVISAYAIPGILSAAADYKLKNTMSQVAAICQQQRMEAVRTNATMNVANTAIAGALPRGVTSSIPPTTISGAPTLDTVALASYQTEGTTVPVQFNARGLPCVTIGTACSNWDSSGSGQQVGFLIYFKMDKAMGGSGWGAITITPAGRIRTWFYDGSSYEKM